MTLLFLSVAWVFASAGVAMLPIRQQFIPVALLLALAGKVRRTVSLRNEGLIV